MGIKHLQQQVVQRHFVLALYAVQVLHAFVAHVSDVGEQEEQLSLSSGLLLHRGSRLANVMYEGISDGV